MSNNEETKKINLHQRLAAAMQQVSYIQKEKPSGMQYSIVSHDAVTAKVRPALLDNGIVYYPTDLEYVQNGNRTEVKMIIRFVNIDEPTDYIDVPSLGFGIGNDDKGSGKSISYAVKYALLKTLGLETGEDSDYDQNVRHETEADKKSCEKWFIDNNVSKAHANAALKQYFGNYDKLLIKCKGYENDPEKMKSLQV